MRAAAAPKFSPDCRLCPRLARFLDQVRSNHPGYHARPVAPFGPARAKLLIVGLAPGMHGANRTGRPFTGDYAGILLHDTLHRFGFANRPVSVARGDGLRLVGCRKDLRFMIATTAAAIIPRRSASLRACSEPSFPKSSNT